MVTSQSGILYGISYGIEVLECYSEILILAMVIALFVSYFVERS